MVAQLFCVGRYNIISMTETKCFMWDIQQPEVRKVYQLKGLPDCSAAMTSNSILLNTFEQPGNSSVYQDVGMPSNAVHVMYCMAGHKISAGEISLPSQQERSHWGQASKEVLYYIVYDFLALCDTSYMLDGERIAAYSNLFQR